MNGIGTHEIIFFVVFGVLVFIVPIIVIRASYNPTTKFDASTLWTHQGRVDKFAVIILGTWWIHASSLILWTLLRTVTTTDYVTFMGWAIPIIAKMFAPQSNQPGGPQS